MKTKKKLNLREVAVLMKELMEYMLIYAIVGIAFGTCFGIIFGYVLIAFEMGGIIGLISAIAGILTVVLLLCKRYNETKQKKKHKARKVK